VSIYGQHSPPRRKGAEIGRAFQKSALYLGPKKKKRGRPATTGRGVQIGMRWQDPDLEMIDDWIGRQKEPFTRPEAIRRLVELGLRAKI
jgi:hypothetical protein